MPQTTTVEKVRERVLHLAREIESLSRSEVPPEEFFPQFLEKLVKALGADAGAVWMLEGGQRLGLKAEIGLDAIGFRQNPNATAQNHALLMEAMSTGQAAVYVPGETDKELPTQHQIVLAALQTGTESAGVVQIFQRAAAPKEARPGYLQFVEQTCGYATRYLEQHPKRKVDKLNRQIGNQHKKIETLLEVAENLLDRCEKCERKMSIISFLRLTTVFIGVATGVYCGFEYISANIFALTISSLILFYLALTFFYLRTVHETTKRFYAREKRALNSIVDMLREVEPSLSEEEGITAVERAEFRIRLARFDVGWEISTELKPFF